MRKYLKIFFILISCLLILSGCSVSEQKTTVEDKNLAELEYIEDNIVLMMNKFIKDEYLDEESQTQKWDEILGDARKIENSIATTLVDLATLNIDATEVAKLSAGVNNLVIAIENEDETNFIVELNNIYALIPNYLSKYLKDDELIFKKQLKYYAISTFVGFKIGNTDLARSQIAEAETKYAEKMKDVNYVQNNEYNANKIYVLIQELKAAVETDSEELMATKYLLLVEEI